MKLFVDIETVPCVDEFYKASDDMRECYEKKFRKDLIDKNISDHFFENAGLYAEFGKIVCVSVGYIRDEKIVLKSFFGDPELQILKDVADVLLKATSLVAHNGKDFDYPWLCRRMITNQISLPPILQIQNLKPWEIKLEDTVDMWKFGQFQHKASLATMCCLFGLPSPKKGMDGSQVAHAFYFDGKFEEISRVL